MKVLHLTREFPPHVYGGAGVHVDHLTRALAAEVGVEVRCFDEADSAPRGPRAITYPAWEEALARAEPRLRRVLGPLTVNAAMASDPTDADLVHAHTWYTMAAGVWMRILYGIPLVVTAHSLEPLRPWKEEQLGRGYLLSSRVERDALETAEAIVAVSARTREEIVSLFRVEPDRVHVVPNGVDTEVFRPEDPAPALARFGIPPGRPYVLFVGRITQQKGVLHLVRAAPLLPRGVPLVLCAAAPDTEAIGKEMDDAVEGARRDGAEIHWIREMVPVPDLARLYGGAALFVCPSIYEPFGIINLEAMACGCPVVASRVGGIPEVVLEGETGLLVPFVPRGNGDHEPADPRRFAADLANAVSRLLENEPLRARLGRAGIRRVRERFSWGAVGRRTVELYREVLAAGIRRPHP